MYIKQLQNNIGNEIINNTNDIILDIGEIGIDSIFDESVLEEIPILKTLAAVCKTGLNIRERHFSKKLVCFINEYQNNINDTEKFEEFKKKMKNDNFKSKITEKLIIILDRLEEVNKSKQIAVLFNSYIEQQISWNEFCIYSKYIDFMVEDDFELLRFLRSDIENGYCLSKSEKIHLEESANKLVYYCFVKNVPMNSAVYGSVPTKVKHYITEDGIKFINCFDCEEINNI